jgi:hypothetical protein
MNIDFVKVRIPVWLIVVLVTAIATAGLSYWYYRIGSGSEKELGIVGGLVSGLAVFLLTYITVIGPGLEVERFKRMGIIDVLNNRHDKAYYRHLVKDAKNVVRVMGASCGRFVEDFLDTESDDKVLLDALHRNSGLTVQLLVPEARFMSPETATRAAALPAQLAKVEAMLPGRVQLRKFGSQANHSFVIVDNAIVAGPIFQDDKSKYAPAVHMSMKTVFAMRYNEYFEKIWGNSVP